MTMSWSWRPQSPLSLFLFFFFFFFFEMGTLLMVMPLVGADLVVQDDGIEFVRCWWRARGFHWKRVENFQYCSSFTKLESRQDVVLLSKMIKDRLARGKFVSPTTWTKICASPPPRLWDFLALILLSQCQWRRGNHQWETRACCRRVMYCMLVMWPIHRPCGCCRLKACWKIAFFETPFVLRHSVYSQLFIYLFIYFFSHQQANKELVDNEFVFRNPICFTA